MERIPNQSKESALGADQDSESPEQDLDAKSKSAADEELGGMTVDDPNLSSNLTSHQILQAIEDQQPDLETQPKGNKRQGKRGIMKARTKKNLQKLSQTDTAEAREEEGCSNPGGNTESKLKKKARQLELAEKREALKLEKTAKKEAEKEAWEAKKEARAAQNLMRAAEKEAKAAEKEARKAEKEARKEAKKQETLSKSMMTTKKKTKRFGLASSFTDPSMVLGPTSVSVLEPAQHEPMTGALQESTAIDPIMPEVVLEEVPPSDTPHLNEAETLFLEGLRKNEALSEYFDCLKFGILKLLMEPLGARTTSLNSNFEDVFPGIKSQFREVDKEATQATKRVRILELLEEQARGEAARIVAGKLMIRRRDYLMQLTVEELKKESSNPDLFSQLVEKEGSVYDLRGKMDLFWIEAFLLSTATEEISSLEVATDFSEIIVIAFFEEQKSKHLSPNLKLGEIPPEFPPQLIPQSYFDSSSFPPSLQKLRDERAKDYELRVCKHLHQCTNEQFEQIGTLVDPTKPEEKKLFKIFMEVERIRAMNEANLKQGEACCQCEIF